MGTYLFSNLTAQHYFEFDISHIDYKVSVKDVVIRSRFQITHSDMMCRPKS